MNRRLLWQIYPTFLAITILALFAISWNVKHLITISYRNEKQTFLERIAHLSLPSFHPLVEDDDLEKIQAACQHMGHVARVRITVIDLQGKVLGDSDEQPERMVNHFDRPEFQQALTGNTGTNIRFSETLQQEMMYVAVPITLDDTVLAVLRTSVEMAELQTTLQSIFNQIFRYGLIITLLLAVLSLAISWKISHPLELLRRGAERFAKGDLHHRLPVSQAREIGELAVSMNEMAAQLDERIRTIVAQKNEQQAVLASMIEGVVAVTIDGRIISLNKAAAGILQSTIDESTGRTVEEVVRNNELQHFIRNAMESKEAIEGQIILHEQNQTERFLQVHGTALQDDKNQKIGVLIVLNDVTHIRRLEQVRRDFVANVSHELKTPVTSIKGFIETLLEGTVTKAEDTQRFLEIIARQTNRLDSIIDDLLMLSRIEQQSEHEQVILEPAFIKPILFTAASVCETTSVEKNIRIEIDCPDSLQACVNASLLEQAIVNLVDNAIKYSNLGSDVRIEALQTETQILIHVHDHGCGIAKEHLGRLFERFYRVDKARSRKLGGTGLGLAIVKHIANSHKGSVTVESTVGQGSTFTLHLPSDEVK
jgi:two-component system phosphate regulon sensor histidine kinase PhoR